MSSLGINFSGLASGIDSNAIINALVSLERRPITLLENRKTALNGQKSLFGDLETRLNSLRDTAKALKDTSNFLEFAASVDSDKLLTATASNAASTGTYNIKVNSLAEGQVNSSLGKADKDITNYGTGTLRINVDPDGPTPEQFSVTIDTSNNTLEGIAAAINSANGPFQATILDTGSGTTPHKLVLSSTETGEDFDFSVVGEGTELATLATEINGNVDQAASNASVDINGTTISRSSNTISDAITGVTLNLTAADLGATTTKLTINTDASATADKVQKFVDAYNSVVDFFEAQNAVDKDGNAQGGLFGDFTLRSIRGALRSTLGTSVDTGNNAVALLSQIGVDSDNKGRLTFNKSKFEKQVAADPTAVRDLFAKESVGIATTLFDQIDQYTDTVDGLIVSRKKSFDDQVRRFDDQIRQKTDRLKSFEASQRERFANLESLLARLQSQGSALSSFQFPTAR